jgi:PAS domain S-box-containing protein
MKILVVDDDEIALAVVKKILENNHYEVVLADDGDAALEILRSKEIRIVISDWNMPKVTGTDLCRYIRSDPGVGYTYIILVSARSSKEDMIVGLSAGADDFISKPFEPAELLARVRTAERVLAMEKDIKQSESRNSALLGAIPDLIFRIRTDGAILDYKPSSNDVIGARAHNIKGELLSSLLPESLTHEAMISIQKALEKKEIQTMEFTQKIGDSSYVFEARIKDSGVDEVTAIVRDISDRARLDQMKSDFINRATHELRTPIATMLLMVNLMDGINTTEEYKEYWDVLKSELHREHLLVEDLLSAGRMESNQTKLNIHLINVAETLKQTVHKIGLSAKEKDMTLVLHVADEVSPTSYLIQADENALTQVFVNLLGNAVKFSLSGSTINVFLKKEIDGVGISIIDTGMGIPSEDIPLLFGRFFRGTNAIHEEIPGTGIGLYIVRSILEKHNGNIKVHSELGKGSQFDIWLPAIFSL